MCECECSCTYASTGNIGPSCDKWLKVELCEILNLCLCFPEQNKLEQKNKKKLFPGIKTVMFRNVSVFCFDIFWIKVKHFDVSEVGMFCFNLLN